MHPVFRVCVLLVVCWSTLFAVGNAAAAGRELRSPRLSILDNHSFSLVAPAGWHVSSRDPASNWQYAGYEFTLAPNRSNSLADGSLGVEILQHGIERARRHRDLEGERFRSHDGQRGFLHYSEYAPGTRDWYFAVPVTSTRSALIVRVMFKRGGYWRQDAFVRSYFRSLRFGRPGTAKSHQT